MKKGKKSTLPVIDCKTRLGAIADALYAIGGKWKLQVVVALMDGNRRFNQLQRVVHPISARVLSQELKELEMNGFVKRKVIDETPVVVEYELLPYADTLHGVLTALSGWGLNHKEQVKHSMRKKK